jgi:lipopolysaccharide export system permease protein
VFFDGTVPVIIRFYLLREIGKPFVLILSVLVALFASFNVTNFLAEAVNGLLPSSAIVELTALKALISLEVLIPASLYAAVLISFSKLYDESEFAAMSALGITSAAILRDVLVLACGLALIVGAVSLFVRPWAYQRLHELSASAGTLLDVDSMESGSFYVVQNGSRVIFLSHRDQHGSPARNVFIKASYPDHTQIISAQLAYSLQPTTAGSSADVSLNDVNIYQLAHGNGQTDQVLQAAEMTVDPNSHADDAPSYSALTARSLTLVGSHDREDVAELQWRLSTPISTILLGMLGVPLSRTRPRERKIRNFLTAFLIYAGYYLVCTSARTMVQHGALPAVPGIWWVPGLLALIVAFASREPGQKPGIFASP